MFIRRVIKHLKHGTLLRATALKLVQILKLPQAFTLLKVTTVNLSNIVSYGFDAPRYNEIIWVKPEECDKVLHPEAVRSITGNTNEYDISAKVIDMPWPKDKAFTVTECSEVTYANDLPDCVWQVGIT